MKIVDIWRWAFSDKITWNVSTIPFKEGDTIILATDRVLCNEQRARMAAHVKSYMPEGAKVVVLDGGLKIAVASGTSPDCTELVTRWENSARKQFQCAEMTDDPTGRRVMEHGAMVYFNCAQAIRQSQGESSLPTLPNQAEH